MCSHYGNRGHTIEICFKKHGYPSGWGTRESTTYVNNVVADTDAEGTIPIAPQSSQMPVQGFSPEQIQPPDLSSTFKHHTHDLSFSYRRSFCFPSPGFKNSYHFHVMYQSLSKS